MGASGGFSIRERGVDAEITVASDLPQWPQVSQKLA